MRNSRRSLTNAWIVLISSLVFVCAAGVGLTTDTSAANASAQNPSGTAAFGATPGEKAAPDLLRRARDPQTRAQRVRVVLQLNGRPGAALNALLQRGDVKTSQKFQNFEARVLELPAHLVEQMASHPEVRFVSPDRETVNFGHVSRTTGADNVRATTGVVANGLDGTGIGIAILDSGIDTAHTSFLNRSNGLRVVHNRDFTGEGRTDDPYGHGTHVASIAAGNGRISNAEYIGIAPNANIINLRVLNSRGTGTVSSILSALDWILTNRAVYNIRVANLSLGTAAIESYANDPICRAVRKLVNAGVAVVAAASNNGKEGLGNKI